MHESGVLKLVLEEQRCIRVYWVQPAWSQDGVMTAQKKFCDFEGFSSSFFL